MKNRSFTAMKIHFFKKDVDTESILIFNKAFSSEKNYKYFIGYLCDDNKVKPLHIILPKASVYIKIYDDKTKWMYFLIEDDDLLNKYNDTWDEINDRIKKNLMTNLSAIKISEYQNKIY